MAAHQAELRDLAAERDSLKDQLVSKTASEESRALSIQMETLTAEKNQLEVSFIEEKTRLEALIRNEREKASVAVASKVGMFSQSVSRLLTQRRGRMHPMEAMRLGVKLFLRKLNGHGKRKRLS